MSNTIQTVTVGFYRKNPDTGVLEAMLDDYTGEIASITFDLREEPFIWNRGADADARCDEDGHLHWNAATGMFYRDGVFSWEEHGPRHSEEEIRKLVATGEVGTRKAVTYSKQDFCYFLDHHDMYLKIEETQDSTAGTP